MFALYLAIAGFKVWQFPITHMIIQDGRFSLLGSSLLTRWKITEDGLGPREEEREDGGGGENKVARLKLTSRS